MWTNTFIILDLAFKGIIIGIAASAPMGPSGVLAVQRTLNKGRWFGFVTGVGVALSDIVYALIAGFGLNLILDFISNPTTGYWLQLIGSVLLCAFGWHVFHSRPAHRIAQATGKNGTLIHNAITGFLITFSNPLIILLYLALFARFNFIVPDHPLDQTIGFLFLLLGSLMWWYGLSYVVSKLGSRFRESGLIWMNRTIGVVVMVVSLLGFYFTLRGKALF